MICMLCNHYSHADREMARAQASDRCTCRCHPWNRPAHERHERERETIEGSDVENLDTIGFQDLG